MGYLERLGAIEYQLIKNMTFTPTDEQLVGMTQSILTAVLRAAELKGEDLPGAVQAGTLPTTFLGVTVTWDQTNPEGDSFTLTLNGITVTQDADDPIGMIIDTTDGINDAEAVALDMSSLQVGLGTNTDLNNVSSNLTFPLTGTNGTTITWDASGHSAVDNAGAVTTGGSDIAGTITATIEKGSESDTKTFSVTVLQSNDSSIVAADKLWLDASQVLNGNTDLNNVETDLTFPTVGPNGSTIAWDASANSAISNTGIVTQEADNVTGNVIATITSGAVSDTGTFSITVLEDITLSNTADVTADKLWLDASQILNGNTDLNNVETNLTFPTVGPNGSTITWNASSHSAINNTGVVTQEADNVTGNVVATITKDTASDTDTFSITVLEDITLSNTADVTADKLWLDASQILNGNTDLNNVTTDLTFPTVGPNGSTISWNASANSAISNTGVVTQEADNVTGNVVATITKDTASDTDTFSITVLEDITLSNTADVAADKAWLDASQILNGNTDLNNVETNLTFPTVGPNGSTITWNASANSAISNTGIVTQEADNVTGNVVATITSGEASDTDTFSITVLAEVIPFITTWQTDATGNVKTASNQIELPLGSGVKTSYNFTVDWGDGNTDTITSDNQPEIIHTYSTAGTYDITIDGVCEGWGFREGGPYEDNSKLTGIKQWGSVKLHDGGGQFRNCDNLSSYTATDVLDTSNVTYMYKMFYQTTLPTGFDISLWNTSSATQMGQMFYQATLPSGFDISTWDTSSVTNMSYMFNSATLPTGFDISLWNTSSVTDMSGMFYGATIPTGFDISGWNTSLVTDMSYMFNGATLPDGFDIPGWNTSLVTDMSYIFNSATLPTGFDISLWNTSSVTDMGSMFYGVTLPTGFDISTWDTSSVTNMIRMFRDATIPTGFDISGWNTSSVTNMSFMFENATLPTGFDISLWNTLSVTTMGGVFNGATLPDGFDISGWNTSSVTYMVSMFHSVTLPTGFDISLWNTSSVTNMSWMFYGATIPTGFDISGWNTSLVTDMSYMFNGATLPDPFDLSGWDISSINSLSYASMSYMFYGATLSTANYDALLNGWSTLDAGETQIPTNVTFRGGNSKYSAAGETARDTLVNTYGWTIADGGFDAAK